MAGTADDFDADEFRTNIHTTMLMALPSDPAERPRFLFPSTQTYDRADKGGEPFDFTTEPAGDPPRDPVLCGDAVGQVLCAWEEAGSKRRPSETVLGNFDPDRLLLTMLDVDWAVVDGFDRVIISDNTYLYEKESPQRGLHDVTVHQITLVAEDES